MTAKNKKLTISPCTVDKNGKVSVDSGKKFEVMLNPASYKQNFSISYNKGKTLGQNESDPNFSAINPKKFDLTILIDGTGVVESQTPGKPDVLTQINQLNDTVGEPDFFSGAWSRWPLIIPCSPPRERRSEPKSRCRLSVL